MSELIKYTIKGKEVTKDEFDNFLESLKKISETWFCDELTLTDKDGKEVFGGETGYDAEDEEGNVYEYRCLTSPDLNTCSITKRDLD
ncbi:MAG: hypothetical protein ACFFA5_03405 [Promethearchaeota archaeon]